MDTMSITESINRLSVNIDLLDVNKCIETLCKCEFEMFWNEHGNGLLDKDFLKILSSFKNQFSKDDTIILVWAWTSWRICKMIADLYNKKNGEIKIVPMLAWWSDSLIKAQVNAEDRWQDGYDIVFKFQTNFPQNCILIGVTCWLSSSYVAWALEAWIELWFKSVSVIWFNKWNQATMKFVDQNHISKITILNPILGAEAIRWSVRMKWWSATIIILSLLFEDLSNLTNHVEWYLKQIEKNFVVFYKTMKENMISFFELWATTLRKWESINYFWSDFISYLFLFDCVECYPTFWATEWQINVFIKWWTWYFNQFKYDHFIDSHEIDFSDFSKKEISWLAVFWDSIFDLDVWTNVINIVNLKKIINMSWFSLIEQILFYRSLLSNFSTYSFIQAWKVYRNMMIDVKITNRKLCIRACRIIGEILQINMNDSHKQLVKTINRWSAVKLKYWESNLEEVIVYWSKIKNIVSKVILFYRFPNRSIDEIELMLSKEPVLRKVITDSIM